MYNASFQKLKTYEFGTTSKVMFAKTSVKNQSLVSEFE
jgi:hypothetical protein